MRLIQKAAKKATGTWSESVPNQMRKFDFDYDYSSGPNKHVYTSIYSHKKSHEQAFFHVIKVEIFP